MPVNYMPVNYMPVNYMPVHSVPFSAAPAPSTPLGPFLDSAVTWGMWVTLMGFVGLIAFALLAAGPVARRIGPDAQVGVATRLARAALVVGVLAAPAILIDLAHDAAKAGGFDYAGAWGGLYDGSNAGRLIGLEVTCAVVGAALVAPVTSRTVAAGRWRNAWFGGALTAGLIALGATRFPDEVPANWPRTIFGTFMWFLHLFGGAIWIGGLAALLLLTIPGAVAAGDRREFWSPTIRRFSVIAMSCVAAITLSGLFLYWSHVDGPTQLFTTMYGRVLGVKILIFGTLLMFGVFNQFWLHPRIEALRAAGDDRPLLVLVVREFRVAVTVELLLGLSVLFVAPFLHGSARSQAFQAEAAEHLAAGAKLPKLAAKQVSCSTWVWGVTETVVVIGVMVIGYYVSGRIARRRSLGAPVQTAAPAPGEPSLLDG